MADLERYRIEPITGLEELELQKKPITDPVLKNLSDFFSRADETLRGDPFIAMGGPPGKGLQLGLKELGQELLKHQRIASLFRSGAKGDIAEAEQIRKTLKIKNPAEAERLYLEASGKGKQLASQEDIAKAIEDFNLGKRNLAKPTSADFENVTREEILDYIKTIPFKERLALYADDNIPLKGKYEILDSDKIDFYKDLLDINKLPKDFRSGDNTLARALLRDKDIAERFGTFEKLDEFRPRPYFEEVIDFDKGTEKIKLFIPQSKFGNKVTYKQKTLTNPSKEQLDTILEELERLNKKSGGSVDKPLYDNYRDI